MYKRIFVAIDDSNTAQKALDEAIRIASAVGAGLCIAHASDQGPLEQHGMGLGSYIDVDKARGEIREAGNQLLERAAAKAAAAGVKAERLLMESGRRRVAEMITDGARDWKADLVVVGTHGRRGFERMLVGSVADNLVRMSTTSLLLVREQ